MLGMSYVPNFGTDTHLLLKCLNTGLACLKFYCMHIHVYSTGKVKYYTYLVMTINLQHKLIYKTLC